MANPYAVTPFGGANVGQMYRQTLTGIGQAIGQKRQQDAALQKQAEGKQAIASAFQSGDPNQIAQTMISYPDLAQPLQQAMKFKSDSTRDNFIQSAREVVLNPQDTEQILTRRIEQVTAEGGDPSQSISALEEYRENPEQFLQSAKNVYAAYDPNGFQAYMEAQPETKEGIKPTANIQDYEYYAKLKGTDPEGAKMFASSVGLIEQPKDVKKTTAMQNFETWKAMPEGEEKEAFAQLVGISPKKSSKQLQEEVDKIAGLESEISSIENTVAIGEELLNHPGFDSYFGFTSIFPSVPGGDAADFGVALESFTNNLTLDNLSKMSGVLTDKDIQVLSSAAAAIDKGMSDKAARKELKKIFSRLRSQSRSKQKQLGKLSNPTGDNNTPPVQQTQQLTDDQLLSKYLD